MKNLLLLSLSIILISCTNKHEKLIDEYMKEHLHNYSSYEPISFEVDSIMEVVDTVFRSEKELVLVELELLNEQYKFNSEKIIKEIDKSISEYSNKLKNKNEPKNIDELVYFSNKLSTNRDKFLNKTNSLFGEFEELGYKHNKLMNKLDSLNKVSCLMDKALDRWVVTHKYRVDNGYGSLSVRTTKFIINKDKTEILDSFRVEN